jgi:RNA polymerase sigma factor (sigma-70 family)
MIQGAVPGEETSRRLIEENLGLAKQIASRFDNMPVAKKDDAEPVTTQDDIVQYAIQALSRAAEAWVAGKSQSGKGDFKAYAATAIWNALNGVYTKEKRHSFYHVSPSGEADPDDEDPQLRELENTYRNTIEAVRQNEAKDALETAMKILGWREKVVAKKFMAAKSLSEISKDIGISKQRVSQILHPALAKLKSELEKLNVRGVATDGFARSTVRGLRKNLSEKTKPEGA